MLQLLCLVTLLHTVLSTLYKLQIVQHILNSKSRTTRRTVKQSENQCIPFCHSSIIINIRGAFSQKRERRIFELLPGLFFPELLWGQNLRYIGRIFFALPSVTSVAVVKKTDYGKFDNKQKPNWYFWPGVYVIGLIFLQAGGFTVVAVGFDRRLPTATDGIADERKKRAHSYIYHRMLGCGLTTAYGFVGSKNVSPLCHGEKTTQEKKARKKGQMMQYSLFHCVSASHTAATFPAGDHKRGCGRPTHARFFSLDKRGKKTRDQPSKKRIKKRKKMKRKKKIRAKNAEGLFARLAYFISPYV
jgi:hypothetical protein